MLKIFALIIFCLALSPIFANTVLADTFAYDKFRLRSLEAEQKLALRLNAELKVVLKTDQIPISAKNWSTVVNSYIYGQYSARDIAAAIYYGGKTVHPTISWDAWRRAGDYNKYLKKFRTRGQFNVGDYDEVVVAENGDTLQTSAISAIVIDLKNGEVLYGKNIDQSLPIASLSKLMSAIIFLENNPGWDTVVKYDLLDDDVLDFAAKWEMAYLKINIGDELTVEDLFYTGLVGSANNSIYALARSTGLTRAEFVQKMNDKAEMWGLDDTYFFEPSGLSPRNVSSAKDMSKIAYYAFANENIKKATSYKYWEFRTINDDKYYKVKSINQLLKRDLNFNLAGTKTGYLHESKRCLVAKGKSGKKEVIALVLGVEGWEYFDEVEKLVEYGLKINL